MFFALKNAYLIYVLSKTLYIFFERLKQINITRLKNLYNILNIHEGFHSKI